MQVASARYLTPPAVAERLAVDPHRVLGWIRRGELHAVNVGDGEMRPRYRVSEADLQIFLAARSAGPAPKIARVRRRRDQHVEEFF
ncbi:MAG: helix-turn-helix domain-containing protein [Thermoguttaceae bacterium]